jgi:hypothetical protein
MRASTLSSCLVTLTSLALAATAASEMESTSSNRSLETMLSPPYCFIEVGFDYVGNDIGSAASVNAEGCCQICASRSGCRAFSWTNLNGGTCWLKSGRGTIVVNPDVRSSIVSATGTGCLLDEGIDYVGNDIGNVRSLKPYGCCSACQYTPGCRAFTFTTHDGGTCWLKSKKGRMVVNPQARSAEPYVEDPTCGLEYDTDYVGNDIGNTPASAPGLCCEKCQHWNGCRAFSWTSQNGGTCWIKGLKGETVKKAGVISAYVAANPPAPSCALELGTDYVGNDVGSAASADAYGCCSICMARSDCKAFSWTNANGGTCWLKSAKGATKADANVKSAVV